MSKSQYPSVAVTSFPFGVSWHQTYGYYSEKRSQADFGAPDDPGTAKMLPFIPFAVFLSVLFWKGISGLKFPCFYFMHANCPNGDGNQSSFGRFRYYYVNYRTIARR